MKDTKIEWAHHTFNPWWGCEKVSPGCAHCYAEALARRWGKRLWGGADTQRQVKSEAGWREPLAWDRAAAAAGERHRVFCASLADVFEDREDLRAPRRRLFGLIDATPNLIWLLLTKRPENITRLNIQADGVGRLRPMSSRFPNVWFGTTAENQTWWDRRVPRLLEIEARCHFVSAEPLLGPIRMGECQPDWLIVGGESGPKARPMDPGWVRDLRDHCHTTTAFFFKQWGGTNKQAAGRQLDGRTWDEVPQIA